MSDRRTHRFELRLNDSEKATLDKKSIKAGVSKSAFIKMCLNNSEIKSAPSTEYQDLIREINYIGHNINQITKAVNMGIALPDDIKRIYIKLADIYELIKERL